MLSWKKNTEISIENVKIDKITDEYLVEIKKSDADVEATKWQTLLYLKVLKSKGVEKKGKIEFIEKNKQDKKIIYVELNEEKEKQLEKLIHEIENFIVTENPPKLENKTKNKCKKCAFYDYCYI